MATTDNTTLFLALGAAAIYAVYTIKKGVSDTVQGVATGVQGIGQGVSDVSGGVGRVVGSAGEAAGSFFDIFDTIFDKAKQGWESIGGSADDSDPMMSERMERELESIKQMRKPLTLRTDNIQQQSIQNEAIQKSLRQGYGTFDTIVAQSVGLALPQPNLMSLNQSDQTMQLMSLGNTPASVSATKQIRAIKTAVSTAETRAAQEAAARGIKVIKSTGKYTPTVSSKSVRTTPTSSKSIVSPTKGTNPALRSSALRRNN